ncbi:hypothetical protein [Asticcacaulis sp. AC402]|nr:hypothetical protein [Asticcacaulis sp. AC402]ESQ76336.1 hypothetical protein ABAC402_04355 [Asticcacaulis sp. AC402]
MRKVFLVIGGIDNSIPVMCSVTKVERLSRTEAESRAPNHGPW